MGMDLDKRTLRRPGWRIASFNMSLYFVVCMGWVNIRISGPAMIGWAEGRIGSFAGGLNFVSGSLALSAVLMLLLAHSGKPAAATANAACN